MISPSYHHDAMMRSSKGTNLKVLSRVTDKESGDVGHPVQYDGVQWYINVTGDDIKDALSGSAGRTEPSFVKRISDTRSLDEKIYRLRLAIPKEIDNSWVKGARRGTGD